MKRIFAFCLAILMSLAVCACSFASENGSPSKTEKPESTETSSATSETREETDPARILDMEKKTFGGYEFRFLIRQSSYYALDSHEILAEDEGGDVINDAVYHRNRQIEEEYDCVISGEKTYSPSVEARSSLLAGEYVADFLYDEARLLRSLTAHNLFMMSINLRIFIRKRHGTTPR